MVGRACEVRSWGSPLRGLAGPATERGEGRELVELVLGAAAGWRQRVGKGGVGLRCKERREEWACGLEEGGRRELGRGRGERGRPRERERELGLRAKTEGKGISLFIFFYFKAILKSI